MLELFLSTTLTCQQSDAIMLKIKLNESLPEEIRLELVETVKDYTKECGWDANDWRNGRLTLTLVFQVTTNEHLKFD